MTSPIATVSAVSILAACIGAAAFTAPDGVIARDATCPPPAESDPLIVDATSPWVQDIPLRLDPSLPPFVPLEVELSPNLWRPTVQPVPMPDAAPFATRWRPPDQVRSNWGWPEPMVTMTGIQAAPAHTSFDIAIGDPGVAATIHPLSISAPPVAWNGGDVHLLHLHHAMVFHGEDDRLVVAFGGSLLTFDDVTYRVSVAVRDADGALLGAGFTHVDVQRVWLGLPGLMVVQPFFVDLGLSQSWSKAHAIDVSISDRPVLTPDVWQKDPDAATP